MRALAGLVAALAVGLAAAGDRPAGTPPADADHVERLVARLGSGAFRDREAASRELAAVGAPALDALRRAANSADPEARRRAADLIDLISERLAAARILAPTLVEFDYKDRPLADAVQDLAHRTGATISLSDPVPNHFRGRTVTAATSGPVPFWEAVELFCRKADVHEWDGATPQHGLVPQQQQPAQIIGQIGQGGFQGRIIVRGGRVINPATGPNPNVIVLRDGPAPALPTHRAGAVRVRALPVGTPVPNVAVGADEVLVPLQVAAEPKLQWHGVVDLRIDRAVDEHGRAVAVTPAVPVIPGDEDELVLMPNGMFMPRPPMRAGPAGVRVRRADRPAARLAELAGTIAAKVRVAEPLVTIDAPLKAADQTVRGSSGAAVKVASIARAADGAVTVSAQVTLPPDVQVAAQAALAGLGGQVQFQGVVGIGGVVQRAAGPGAQPQPLPAGTTEYQGLALEDARGRRFAAARGLVELTRFGPDGSAYQFTATYKPAEAGQEPARLVFTATRPATVEIPFAVKDVALQ